MGGSVAQLLEETELNLFAEVGVDASEDIPEEGASPVPDVAKEEQQGKRGVAEGEPAPR